MSSVDKISQFISPEILQEIRDSFLQKYGLGICVYDCQGEPLTAAAIELPSLANLNPEEKEWFRIFYDVKDALAGLPQGADETLMQQFAFGLLVRCIFAVGMNGKLFGYACIVDVRRVVEKKENAAFFNDLKDIYQARSSISALLDEETTAISGDHLRWNQELRDVLQLFLEAGKARAHIDKLTDAPEHIDKLTDAPAPDPSIAEAGAGILFCTANGVIIEALPDAAELLGYNTPEDLCDLNFLSDLVVDVDNRAQLAALIESKNSDPAAAVLFRKDHSHIEVTLQFIPQQAGNVLLGFECQLVAQPTPQLDKMQEYEQDQTAIGLIAERTSDLDEFELAADFKDMDLYPNAHAAKKVNADAAGKPPMSLEKGSPIASALAGISHLLEASATPMFLVDAKERIQLWNGAMAALLGLPAKSVLKKNVSILLVANIQATWQRWRTKLLKSPPGAVLKPKVLLPLIKKDKAVALSAVELSVIDLFGKKYLAVALKPHDEISATRTSNEKKSREENAVPEGESGEALESLEELQHHYKNVRAQFSQIAEILSANVSNIYLESLQNEESKKRYTSIKRVADISAYIERNLAYFTQQVEPNVQRVDVNYILGEIVDRLQQFLPLNIELQANFAESLAKVSADPDMLVHALGSICKNAIDAMPGGGVLAIETTMDADKKNVVVAIRDTGVGFSDLEKRRLTQPFQTSKRSALGKGLGLAAAYGIIKAHFGKLTAEPGAGGGACITVLLPAVNEQGETQRKRDEALPQHKAFILVIDDDIDLAEATAMTLTRDGNLVITSTSCSDGLAMFDMYRDEIDIIVIDNLLGESTGLQCAKQILNIDPDARFVFYSGADDDFALAEFIKSSGAGWLKKPFKTKELVEQIEKQLLTRKVHQ